MSAEYIDFDHAIQAYRMSTDPVKSTVAALWADVTDRRGWRQEADQFDDEVRVQILEAWAAIIRRQLS